MIIRLATSADAAQMAALLNEIIAIGGTTAHQTPFDADRMHHHYIAAPTQICCHVAEQEGLILGFQHLDGPDPDQSGAEGWGYIASFVASSAAGKGVGQQLFAATLKAAGQAGVQSINSTIRADNTIGLRYYEGLGFIRFDVLRDVPLRDGKKVDRIVTRFDMESPTSRDLKQ